MFILSLLDQDDDTGMWMIFGGLFLIIISFIGDTILALGNKSNDNTREVKSKGTLALSGDDAIDGKNAARYHLSQYSKLPQQQYYDRMLTIYKDNSTSMYKLRILSHNFLASFWSELPKGVRQFIQREYDDHPEWAKYNI